MNKYHIHRYFIKLSYNGKNYHGWQIQPNGNTVQAELEEKFSLVLKEKISILGSGRTDTGVHAQNYIAHFDCSSSIQNIDNLVFKLNSFLPKDIAIQQIVPVNNEAHARFSAISRTYKYYISTKKDPFNSEYSLYFQPKLNLSAMKEAATILKGYHDFEAFSKTKTDVNNFNCEIFESYFEEDNNLIVYTVKANRFLRNMVRAIVGTLLEVGKGKLSINEFRKVIESKNRSMAGKSVEGKALFLSSIEYPEDLYL